jgi:hypothetical protein
VTRADLEALRQLAQLLSRAEVDALREDDVRRAAFCVREWYAVVREHRAASGGAWIGTRAAVPA